MITRMVYLLSTFSDHLLSGKSVPSCEFADERHHLPSPP